MFPRLVLVLSLLLPEPLLDVSPLEPRVPDQPFHVCDPGEPLLEGPAEYAQLVGRFVCAVFYHAGLGF